MCFICLPSKEEKDLWTERERERFLGRSQNSGLEQLETCQQHTIKWSSQAHINANKPDCHRERRALRLAVRVKGHLMVQWLQMKLFYTSKKLLSSNKTAL